MKRSTTIIVAVAVIGVKFEVKVGSGVEIEAAVDAVVKAMKEEDQLQ